MAVVDNPPASSSRTCRSRGVRTWSGSGGALDFPTLLQDLPRDPGPEDRVPGRDRLDRSHDLLL
jgi:hypothetical protein